MSNPINQNYTDLAVFRNGMLPLEIMPDLAKTFNSFGEKEIADSIGRRYIDGFILGLPTKQIYTKRNLQFIGSFLRSSKDDAFPIFYGHERKVEEILAKNYAHHIIADIITNEEIKPALGKLDVGSKPHWIKMEKNIRKKYTESYAELTIISAKISWYTQKQDWAQLVKANVEKISRLGLDTAGLAWIFTNNMVYEVICKYSNDKKILKRALDWMITINRAYPNDPSCMDTQANLFYKLGRKEEAIGLEEQANEIEVKDAEKQKRIPNDAYTKTIKKMQLGEATF